MVSRVSSCSLLSHCHCHGRLVQQRMPPCLFRLGRREGHSHSLQHHEPGYSLFNMKLALLDLLIWVLFGLQRLFYSTKQLPSANQLQRPLHVVDRSSSVHATPPSERFSRGRLGVRAVVGLDDVVDVVVQRLLAATWEELKGPVEFGPVLTDVSRHQKAHPVQWIYEGDKRVFNG